MEPIPPVEQRPLGSQGLVSSAQGLGAMGMTAFYKATSPGADEAECMRTFARALELGINFIDTAWIYQSHDGSETNEELVRRPCVARGARAACATRCEMPSPARRRRAGALRLRRSLLRAALDTPLLLVVR